MSHFRALSVVVTSIALFYFSSDEPAFAQDNAQTLRVTVLGSGYVSPLYDQFGPSILVEAGNELLLFDSGRGAAIRLEQLDGKLGLIDKIFITHLHSDHVVGLTDVWLTGWLSGRTDAPLRLFGPEGTAALAEHLPLAFAADIAIRQEGMNLPAEGTRIVGTEFKEGVVYTGNGVTVTAFKVNHGYIEEAYGFRIDYGGRSIAISGDTGISENLIEKSRGVDVLLHEVIAAGQFGVYDDDFPAARRQRFETRHTLSDQAGTVFSRVAPRLAVIYHRDGGAAAVEEYESLIAEDFDGQFVVARDLTSVEIGDNVIVTEFEEDSE